MKGFISGILFMALGQSVFAGGDHAGNGGDICELRFQGVRDDLASWILKGGSAGLKFPNNLTLEAYNEQMLGQIRKAHISCTEEAIFIGNAEKTCQNFVDEESHSRIRCNAKRFLDLSQSDQYVLAHHEYAGLSGFEINTGDESAYEFSKQITGFLETHEDQKLVVKPPVASNCVPTDSELVRSIRENDFACMKAIAPKMDLDRVIQTGPNFPGTNWGGNISPLSYAARLGSPEAIRILTKSGAYIHFEHQEGGFAILVAAYAGQKTSIEALVKHGAFLNFNTCTYWTYPKSCDSPLGFAMLRKLADNQTFETVETLLKLGANPNLLSAGQTVMAYATSNFRYIDLLIQYKAIPDMGNESGRTALFFCYTGACVDKLISVGANVNQQDYEHNTALDTAIFQDVRDALIRHGGKPGIKPPQSVEQKRSMDVNR